MRVRVVRFVNAPQRPTPAGVAEWQTQRTQNPPGATPCRFDSDLRHQLKKGFPMGSPFFINNLIHKLFDTI